MEKFFTINRDTTLKQLKAQYQELCKQLHPDVPGGSNREFLRMQREYEGCVQALEKRLARRNRIDGVVRGVFGVLADVMQTVHEDPSSVHRFAERLKNDRGSVEREVGEVAQRFGRELVRTLISREED